MTDECRNFCLDPLDFPRRPHNRPGLSHILYRIGSYSDFRETLLRKLDQQALLREWTHRGADDPGIALLEGAAILGDILTFYQELYANEAYLRTATWRESIADLVRLLGYQLGPGVGGRATFAFEVKGTNPVTVPAQFPLKAEIKGLADPAEFETADELAAVPELSSFNLFRPTMDAAIYTGTSVFSIETADLESANLSLQPGDRLMLVQITASRHPKRQIVTVQTIEEQLDRTEITIRGAWQNGYIGTEIKVYKLGRSFRWFGYNAPPKKISISGNTATESDVDFAVHLMGAAGIDYYALDQQVDDFAVGSLLLVILQLNTTSSATGTSSSFFGSTYFFQQTIVDTNKATLTLGSFTGGATLVYPGAGLSYDTSVSNVYTDLRTVEFHEVIGVPITFKGARIPDPTADNTRLLFFGDGTTYRRLHGRQIQMFRTDPVSKQRKLEEPVVSIDVNAIAPELNRKLRPLALAPQLESFTLADFPLKQPTVTVYGNLVTATQGKTQKPAVLGNGDNRQAFQTFRVPKSPVTYLLSNSTTPPQVPALLVTVDDLEWKEVPSFFGHGPKEQIYVVREDAEGNSWVQFGDGITGARLPSGVDNVAAKYRIGVGAYGPLKPETKVQAEARLTNLGKVNLVEEASGGTVAESGEEARVAAPGKIQSLGRLVSLRDFETEALAIPGVSKVSAAWQLVDNVPALVITVLMQTGRDAQISQVCSTLANYNICRGPQRFPIAVIQGRFQYVYVDAVFAIAPPYQADPVMAAVKQALGPMLPADSAETASTTGLFSVQQRKFGEREYASRIEATIQNAPGVAWAKTTGFGFAIGTATDPAQLTLPSSPRPLVQQVLAANDGVLALFAPHLQLSIAAGGANSVC